MESEFYTVEKLATTGALVKGLNLATSVSPEVKTKIGAEITNGHCPPATDYFPLATGHWP